MDTCFSLITWFRVLLQFIILLFDPPKIAETELLLFARGSNEFPLVMFTKNLHYMVACHETAG